MIHATPPPYTMETSIPGNFAMPTPGRACGDRVGDVCPMPINVVQAGGHPVCKTDQQLADEDKRMRALFPHNGWPIGTPNESWSMDILDGQDRLLGTVRCDHGKLTLMKPESGR